MKYTEDQLVQRTTADYLHEQLGWESVYAYNDEDFGSESLLGRKSDREVVLTRHLRAALVKLNPGLPVEAYHEAVRQIVESSASQTILVANREKYGPAAQRSTGGLPDRDGRTGQKDAAHLRLRPPRGEPLPSRARAVGAWRHLPAAGRHHWLCQRHSAGLHGVQERPQGSATRLLGLTSPGQDGILLSRYLLRTNVQSCHSSQSLHNARPD